MCLASPDISFHSLQQCGPCLRERAQQDVNTELTAVEARFPIPGRIVPEEVKKARIKAEEKLWCQFQGLPDSRFKAKKLPSPEQGCATRSRSRASLRRTEVRPEDVVDIWDEWGGGMSLSDEIAEIEAERAAQGIPLLAPITPIVADDDWSDVTELGGACDAGIAATAGEICDEISDASEETPARQVSQENKNIDLRHRLPFWEKAQKVIHDTTSPNSKQQSISTLR